MTQIERQDQAVKDLRHALNVIRSSAAEYAEEFNKWNELHNFDIKVEPTDFDTINNYKLGEVYSDIAWALAALTGKTPEEIQEANPLR